MEGICNLNREGIPFSSMSLYPPNVKTMCRRLTPLTIDAIKYLFSLVLPLHAKLSEPYVREMIKNQIAFLQGLLDQTEEDDAPTDRI